MSGFESPAEQRYRVAHVFAPFAAAYLLSYVMRSVNAVLSGPLTDEFSLTASQLGLLSSSYFLTFAAMQIPLGAMLDRRGPKEVEVVLLIFAIFGCLISATAEGFTGLWIGRALIGIGVSACLMASYKAYRICFRSDQQASLASLMLMVGSLGALIATLPVELILPVIGWRGVFYATAMLFLLSAFALILLLPRLPAPTPNHKPYWRDMFSGAREVFAHPEVKRLIPLCIFTHGGFMAVQGLWMGPWFRIVDGQSPAQAATSLLILGVVVMCSHLTMSWMGTRFKHWGLSLDKVLLVGCSLMVILTAAAIFDVWGNSVLGWSLMFITTAITAVNYAKVSLAFPVAMGGRANTGVNFIVFVGAFIMQWGLGLIVDLAISMGQDQAQSLKVAFICWMLAQVFSLIWLVRIPVSPVQYR